MATILFLILTTLTCSEGGEGARPQTRRRRKNWAACFSSAATEHPPSFLPSCSTSKDAVRMESKPSQQPYHVKKKGLILTSASQGLMVLALAFIFAQKFFIDLCNDENRGAKAYLGTTFSTMSEWCNESWSHRPKYCTRLKHVLLITIAPVRGGREPATDAICQLTFATLMWQFLRRLFFLQQVWWLALISPCLWGWGEVAILMADWTLCTLIKKSCPVRH